MKSKMITIGCLAGLLTFASCGADFSRNMDYNYDRDMELKAPSAGGKVQYKDRQTGYIDDRQDGTLDREPGDLNQGTNQDLRNVKAPRYLDEQDRSNSPQPHSHP